MTLTPEQRQYRLVPERAVQKAVEDMLTLYGWKWFHAPDNKPSAAGHVQKIISGFPDIIAVRGTRIVVIENKKELEHPREDQEAWLLAFKRTGKVETHIIRPSTMRFLQEQLKPEWAKK